MFFLVQQVGLFEKTKSKTVGGGPTASNFFM